MLKARIQDEQLELNDACLSLKLGLHGGLMLLMELDATLGQDPEAGYELLRRFYIHQLDALLLLPPRECQSLLQELSPEALACLLQLLKGTPTSQQLKKNISSRRLQQLDEEPLYRTSQQPELEQIKAALSDFFQRLEASKTLGELKLPDPTQPSY